MSQENVDKTRDFIEAYNRRDFDAATRWFDPDVEWILPEHQRSDSAIGVKGILRFWEGIDETFEEEQVPHSNALHCRVRGRGSYLAGPMARFNLNLDRLSPPAREAAEEAGIGSGEITDMDRVPR